MVTVICAVILLGALFLGLRYRKKTTMDYPKEARLMGNSNAFYKIK